MNVLYRLYKSLDRAQQEKIRQEYCENFAVERNAFYTAIKKDIKNMAFAKAMFLAKALGVIPEMLLLDPALVLPSPSDIAA